MPLFRRRKQPNWRPFHELVASTRQPLLTPEQLSALPVVYSLRGVYTLDAIADLPDGTVLRLNVGLNIAELAGDEWLLPGVREAVQPEWSWLPATILWDPR